MALSKILRLSSGYECPVLGFGTWGADVDPEIFKTAVKTAIEAGCRHIDTAYVYFNEHLIGEALQELIDARKIRREDVYITTKVIGTHFKHVAELCKKQIEMLRCGYIDLYLVHFPVPLERPDDDAHLVKMNADGKVALDLNTTLEDVWRSMEGCVELGLVRSIGVSNFSIPQMQRILKSAKIKPAMHQLELHPGFQNKKLVKFCEDNDVPITAYSQFGNPGFKKVHGDEPYIDANYLEDERFVAIGRKYGKTSAQVILRWLLQKHMVIIPKSVNPARIIENSKVWDFALTEEDCKLIDSMDVDKRGNWVDYPGVSDHPEYPFSKAGSC